jgi:hypothetical protein
MPRIKEEIKRQNNQQNSIDNNTPPPFLFHAALPLDNTGVSEEIAL